MIEPPPLAPSGLNDGAGPGSGRRVLLAAPQPFYEDRGTPIAVMQVLRALDEMDYQVDLLTYPVGRTFDLRNVRYLRVPNPLRVRSVPVGLSLRKVVLDVLLVVRMRRLLRTGAYDVVHAVEEAAFPAAFLSRSSGTPLIYDMQSSLPEQLAQHRFFRLPLVGPCLRWCERWVLRRVDLVVSSTGLATHVRSILPGGDVRQWRFAALPTPDPEPDENAALRSRLGIPSGAPIVLYTGTFEPYQGLPTLLAALPRVREEVPSVVFVLLGGEAEAAWMRAVEPEMRASLRVVGRRPREEVPRYLAMADVLVSPRVHGGNVPLKVFDYLRAGRPIVATDLPSHRSVLDDSRAALVPPSADGLAAGILRVLGDEEYARRLREAAADYADAHLGWSRFRDEVGEWYGDVLADPPPIPAMDVAVVNYRTPEHLRRCLESVFEQPLSGRVIVADDGSADGSLKMVEERFPEAESLDTGGGKGFGVTANRALASASAPFVLLLNADTRLMPGVLGALGRYLEAHPRVAMVGPRLLNPDGTLQPSCFPFPSPLNAFLGETHLGWFLRFLPLLRARHLRTWAHDRPRRVPWVRGAALAIRRSAFAEAGGFDPLFPMYFEEVDLARRLAEAGWEVHFAPVGDVEHVGGASTSQQPAAMRERYYASMEAYYRRHHPRWKGAVLRAILRIKGGLAFTRIRIRLMLARRSEERERLRSEGAAWRRIAAGP